MRKNRKTCHYSPAWRVEVFAVLVAQTGTSDSLQRSRGPASSSTTWFSIRKFTSFTGSQPSQIFPCQPFPAGDFPKYRVAASGITVARTPESKFFICFQNNASFFPFIVSLAHSLPVVLEPFFYKEFLWAGRAVVIPSEPAVHNLLLLANSARVM